ncbi:MAG: Bug family tripartite tricarboxylate transporter substrate binding protein [Burkholderiaceae bacterium]
MTRRFGRTLGALLATGLICVTGAARAETFPTKPIRIVMPFSPGSGGDVMARLIAQKLGENLGQTVITDSRPGANGIIATDLVAKANPDGHSMLFTTVSIQSINANLFSKLPYDTLKDFAPVGLMGSTTYVLMARNSLPVGSARELVSLAKANPGKYNMAYTTSTPQLTEELFKMSAGIDMIAVPYKGAPPVFVDLLSERLDTYMEALTSALPQIKAGKVKALAVTSARRSVFLPDVPTIAESGYPGFDSVTWAAFFTTAGTPKEVIARLNAEIVRVLQLPDVKGTLLQNGFEVRTSTPEELGDAVAADIAKWARVVKAANIPKLN